MKYAQFARRRQRSGISTGSNLYHVQHHEPLPLSTTLPLYRQGPHHEERHYHSSQSYPRPRLWKLLHLTGLYDFSPLINFLGFLILYLLFIPFPSHVAIPCTSIYMCITPCTHACIVFTLSTSTSRGSLSKCMTLCLKKWCERSLQCLLYEYATTKGIFLLLTILWLSSPQFYLSQPMTKRTTLTVHAYRYTTPRSFARIDNCPVFILSFPAYALSNLNEILFKTI